jgi:hypothetical protein
MIQLKSNKIPKGLVPLENLFDRSDMFYGTNKPCTDQQVEEIDIKSKDTTRLIKVRKGCTPQDEPRLWHW